MFSNVFSGMNTESAGMIFRSLKTKAAPDSNKADQLSKLKRSNFSNSDIVVKKKMWLFIR
jgi:hypothetical protein